MESESYLSGIWLSSVVARQAWRNWQVHEQKKRKEEGNARRKTSSSSMLRPVQHWEGVFHLDIRLVVIRRGALPVNF